MVGDRCKESADEVVMASGKHDADVATDERFSVGMEVTEHGVALPTPDDTNFIGVKAAKE